MTSLWSVIILPCPKERNNMQLVRMALALLATLTALPSTAYGQSYGSLCCSDNTTPEQVTCCGISSVSYIMPKDCIATYQFKQQCVCSWTPVWRPSGFCSSAELSAPGVLEHLWKMAPSGNLLVASCRGTLVWLPRSVQSNLQLRTRPLIPLKESGGPASARPSGNEA